MKINNIISLLFLFSMFSCNTGKYFIIENSFFQATSKKKLIDNKNNIIQEFTTVSYLTLFLDNTFLLQLNTQVGTFECQGTWSYLDKKTIRLKSSENINEYNSHLIAMKTPCTQNRDIKILSNDRLKVPERLTENDESFLIFSRIYTNNAQ